MITNAFDNKLNAIINPKSADRVLTFLHLIGAFVLENYKARADCLFKLVLQGITPFYGIGYKGKILHFTKHISERYACEGTVDDSLLVIKTDNFIMFWQCRLS